MLPTGYFLPYQVNWITDDRRFKLWDKSRRIGATYAESYRAVRRRNLSSEKRDYWFSSADESSAVEFSQYCQQWCKMVDAIADHFSEQLVDDEGKKYTNYVTRFPHSGSRINCMTSNPRRFRSKGGDVCLDEFDWHDKPGEMLDAATPVTTWGYDLSILTTRNAEGSEFDRLVTLVKRVGAGELTWEQARTLAWSYHFTPITVAIDQGLAEKIYKLNHIDPDAREKLLKECRAKARNQDAFNREYMCIPSSAASTLIPYDLYQSCEDPLCMDAEGDGPKYVGFDVGREKHLTSIWKAEMVGDILVVRKRIVLLKCPYDTQLKVLTDVMSDPKVVRGCGDATGIGDMLVESLGKKVGTNRVEKIKFTGPIKEHLASLVVSRMEDRRCRLPDDMAVRESFHSIKKTITAAGNVRYDAAVTKEGHADDFWAFALVCEAAHNPVKVECWWL